MQMFSLFGWVLICYVFILNRKVYDLCARHMNAPVDNSYAQSDGSSPAEQPFVKVSLFELIYKLN